MLEYTYRVFHLPRGTSRDEALRLLTDQAEYHGWEIDRLRVFPDGRRKITLRRRVIRAVRTL